MHTARAFMRQIVAIAVAAVAGCGSSSAVNCHPTSVRACRPLTARGCALFVTSDGKPVMAASCSGGDTRASCLPDDHLECVDDCAAVDGCAAP